MTQARQCSKARFWLQPSDYQYVVVMVTGPKTHARHAKRSSGLKPIFCAACISRSHRGDRFCIPSSTLTRHARHAPSPPQELAMGTRARRAARRSEPPARTSKERPRGTNVTSGIPSPSENYVASWARCNEISESAWAVWRLRSDTPVLRSARSLVL